MLTGVATLPSFRSLLTPDRSPQLSWPTFSSTKPRVSRPWRMFFLGGDGGGGEREREREKCFIWFLFIYSILLGVCLEERNNLDHPTRQAKNIKEWESSLLKTGKPSM